MAYVRKELINILCLYDKPFWLYLDSIMEVVFQLLHNTGFICGVSSGLSCLLLTVSRGFFFMGIFCAS